MFMLDQIDEMLYFINSLVM